MMKSELAFKKLSIGLGTILALSIQGCVTMNQGTSTFYQPKPIDQADLLGCQKLVPEYSSEGDSATLFKRFYAPSEIKESNRIKEGSSLYVSLLYGQFVDISEKGEQFIIGKKARAEIAILANVREFDGRIDHTDKAKQGAKVIFYSDGVRVDGQALNFTSIPMYGPLKYNGGVLTVQVYVLEQDGKESAQLSGVLKQLASLGKIAYPPGTGQLKLLEEVGGALILAGGKDDQEFYHLLALHPDTGVGHIPQATLQAGNIVLIKDNFDEKINGNSPAKGERQNHDHSSFCLNPHDGKLYSLDNSELKPVTNKSYLTIQINSGYPALASKLQAQQTYSELVDEQLKQASSEDSAFQNKINDSLKIASQKAFYDEFIMHLRHAERHKAKSIEQSTSNEAANAAISAASAKKSISYAIEKLRSVISDTADSKRMSDSQVSQALIELQGFVDKGKHSELKNSSFKGDLSAILQRLGI